MYKFYYILFARCNHSKGFQKISLNILESFIYLFVCLFVYLFIYLFIFIYLPLVYKSSRS